eukprot:jgi/Mesvir1/18909/Mv18901-RA.2
MNPGRSSRYKGVTWDTQKGEWRVLLRFDGKMKHFGRYRDKEEAARVADAAILALDGAAAVTNFPVAIEGAVDDVIMLEHLQRDFSGVAAPAGDAAEGGSSSPSSRRGKRRRTDASTAEPAPALVAPENRGARRPSKRGGRSMGGDQDCVELQALPMATPAEGPALLLLQGRRGPAEGASCKPTAPHRRGSAPAGGPLMRAEQDEVGHQLRSADGYVVSLRSQAMAPEARQGGSSQYRGVTWDKQRGRWRVSLRIRGKTKYLGQYDDEVEAARAADAAILARDGATAVTNFPVARECGRDDVIMLEPLECDSSLVAAPAGDAAKASNVTAGEGPCSPSSRRGKRRGTDASTAQPAPALMAPENRGARRPSKRGARSKGGDQGFLELQALPLATPAEEPARLLPRSRGPAEGASSKPVVGFQRGAAPAGGPFIRAGEDEVGHQLRSADGYVVSLRSQAMAPETRQGGSSQYKGVAWDRTRKKWRSRLRMDGRVRYLGSYDNEEEAARAVDAAILVRDGAAAVTNFPVAREGTMDDVIMLEPPELLTVPAGAPEPNGAQCPNEGGGRSRGVDASLDSHASSAEGPASLLPGSRGPAEGASCQPKASHRRGGAPAGSLAVAIVVTRPRARMPETGQRGPSKYRGVHWDSMRKKWRVRLRMDGKMRSFGSYDNEEEAARAADAAILARDGAAAVTNFPVARECGRDDVIMLEPLECDSSGVAAPAGDAAREDPSSPSSRRGKHRGADASAAEPAPALVGTGQRGVHSLATQAEDPACLLPESSSCVAGASCQPVEPHQQSGAPAATLALAIADAEGRASGGGGYMGVSTAPRGKWRAQVWLDPARQRQLPHGGILSLESAHAFSNGRRHSLRLGTAFNTAELAAKARSKFLLLLEGKAADDCLLTRAEEEETRLTFKSADEYLVSLWKEGVALEMSQGGSSKYKGVHWDSQRQNWRAVLRVDGKCRNLGSYKDEEEAARAVDAAILARDGAAAVTNFSFLREGVPDEVIILRSLQRHARLAAGRAGASGGGVGGGVLAIQGGAHEGEDGSALPDIRSRDGPSSPGSRRGKLRRTDASTAEAAPALVGTGQGGVCSLATQAEQPARLLQGIRGPAEGAGCQPMAHHQQGGAPAVGLEIAIADTQPRAQMRETGQRGPSKYRGVHWDGVNHRWRARLRMDGKMRSFGSYDNEEEAARAADAAILARDGAAAVTNFPVAREGGRYEAIRLALLQRESNLVAAPTGDAAGEGPSSPSSRRGKRRGTDASTAEPAHALVRSEKSGARRPNKRGGRSMGGDQGCLELQALPLAMPAEDPGHLLPGSSKSVEGASSQPMVPHQQGGAPQAGSLTVAVADMDGPTSDGGSGYVGVSTAPHGKWRAQVWLDPARQRQLPHGGILSLESAHAFSNGRRHALRLGTAFNTAELAAKARSKFLFLLEGKSADDCPLTRAEEEETRSFRSADGYLVWLLSQATMPETRQGGPSQYKGVTWDSTRKKWQARLRIDGRVRHLGSYDDKEEAARVVYAAISARDGAAAVTSIPVARDGGWVL